MANAGKIIQDKVHYAQNSFSTLESSNGLIVVMEWSMFKSLDIEHINSLLKTLLIFDTRNIYSPEKMRSHRFTYFSIGRG